MLFFEPPPASMFPKTVRKPIIPPQTSVKKSKNFEHKHSYFIQNENFEFARFARLALPLEVGLSTPLVTRIPRTLEQE